MSHDHSHDHHHHGEGQRFLLVATIMLGLGSVELIVATRSHNVLLRSDALHNLSDAVFPLIALGVSFWSRRSQLHFVLCRLSNVVALIGYIITWLLVAVNSWLERHELQGLSQTALLTTAGLATSAVAINLVAHRHLHHDGSHLERANRFHLALDVWISACIAVCALLVIEYDSALLGQIGLALVVVGMALLLAGECAEVYQALHVGRPHVDPPPHHQ